MIDPIEIDPADPASADIIGEPMRQAMLEFRAKYPRPQPVGNWTVTGASSAREALSDAPSRFRYTGENLATQDEAEAAAQAILKRLGLTGE